MTTKTLGEAIMSAVAQGMLGEGTVAAVSARRTNKGTGAEAPASVRGGGTPLKLVVIHGCAAVAPKRRSPRLAAHLCIATVNGVRVDHAASLANLAARRRPNRLFTGI